MNASFQHLEGDMGQVEGLFLWEYDLHNLQEHEQEHEHYTSETINNCYEQCHIFINTG